jgi:hypothetical protein
MGAIMDAAPITFPHNTPIDRVYDAFSKMNLVVIGIVSATTNKYAGVITRRQLLEFTGAAHHQHEKDEVLKPFWQKVKEGIFGEPDGDAEEAESLDGDESSDEGQHGSRWKGWEECRGAPAPLPLQHQLIQYNKELGAARRTGPDEGKAAQSPALSLRQVDEIADAIATAEPR